MSTRQGHALENPKKILEKTDFSFLSRNSKFIEKHELLFWFIYLFEVQVPNSNSRSEKMQVNRGNAAPIYKLDSFSISASSNLGINVYIKLIAHGFRNAKLKCDSEEKTTTELNKMPL